ncbi:MAG: acyl-CoA/acyl-ACP dehydrogenase [Deltaproteobacteria bacterium]|nr:acyl-CoA/acyl-ACP dehydrogenase [Deltaproteobacteria bacterium]
MFDVLLSGQERAVRDEARAFVRDQVDPQLLRDMDADKVEYPREYVRALGKAHLLGLRFPEKYGGRGMSWTAELAALEEVGVLGTALGCAYSMPSIVGEALVRFGTEEQRAKYLVKLISGEMVSAEGLTEPRGGSDFFGATTTARAEGDSFLLNGQKRFVVGAMGADLFLIYARTGDEKAKPHQAISAFLVERAMGVEVQHVYGLMGTRGGGTGRIVFRDVRVPKENLVGELHGGYEVFNRMMVPERMTSAGGALGMGRAVLEVATKYAHKRKAFGRVIRDFEGVSFRIAEAVARTDAARALCFVAGRTVDAGLDGRRLVSEAKKVATEAAWATVNDAMQVLGGIGYTEVFPVERMLRDVRLALIWTGTNEIMNLLVQHEYAKELMGRKAAVRDVELDATRADAVEEKVYE